MDGFSFESFGGLGDWWSGSDTPSFSSDSFNDSYNLLGDWYPTSTVIADTPSSSSWWDNLGTKDVIGALGVGSQIWGQKKAEDQAQATLARADAQSEKEFQRKIELIKLQAALNGGGGGGRGTDMRPYYLNANLQARDAQMKAASEGSTLTVAALKNLMEGAQRPLSR